MSPPSSRRETPSSLEEAGELMRSATSGQQPVRIRGGGTKLSWGRPGEPPAIELSTQGFDQIVEHNQGDMTVVVQAGVPLARLQEALAEANQVVALDPALGDDDRATIGGVLATGDTGPLRHRYGAPRDLILGVTVVLADGTTAKAGGKVIKNVAGYDLAKLFTGSFGTLGLIVEVVMRLHPRPLETATVVGGSDDPQALGQAASAVAHSPFGPECLDVKWDQGRGDILVRLAGAAPEDTAKPVVALMEQAGVEPHVVADDGAVWEGQRTAQRSSERAVVRVSGLASELARVLRSAEDVGASLVGRAGMGLSWLTLAAGNGAEVVSTIEELRRRLHPFPCVVLDAPAAVREKIDVWGDTQAVSLMRRVKARFDPHGVCNRGIFVGGI